MEFSYFHNLKDKVAISQELLLKDWLAGKWKITNLDPVPKVFLKVFHRDIATSKFIVCPVCECTLLRDCGCNCFNVMSYQQSNRIKARVIEMNSWLQINRDNTSRSMFMCNLERREIICNFLWKYTQTHQTQHTVAVAKVLILRKDYATEMRKSHRLKEKRLFFMVQANHLII